MVDSSGLFPVSRCHVWNSWTMPPHQAQIFHHKLKMWLSCLPSQAILPVIIVIFCKDKLWGDKDHLSTMIDGHLLWLCSCQGIGKSHQNSICYWAGAQEILAHYLPHFHHRNQALQGRSPILPTKIQDCNVVSSILFGVPLHDLPFPQTISIVVSLKLNFHSSKASCDVHLMVDTSHCICFLRVLSTLAFSWQIRVFLANAMHKDLYTWRGIFPSGPLFFGDTTMLFKSTRFWQQSISSLFTDQPKMWFYDICDLTKWHSIFYRKLIIM